MIDITPEQPALPVHVPSFAELVELREIGPGKPLIYGFHKDTGHPEKGPLKEQYSIFTIGLPGFGKTTHAVYFIASAVLAEQASFDVLDWHYPDEESLGYALGDLVKTPYVNLVTNPFDLPDLLQEYRDNMTQRARMPKDSYHARILVVDENETWIKNVKELASAESDLINEGRKFKLYVLITSKSAKADKMGGDSDIKNQCTTSYCFRTKPQNAKTFFQDSDKEKLVKQLKEPGECVFTNRKNDSAIVTIPFTTRHDMTTLVDLIPDGNTIRKTQSVVKSPKHIALEQNPELVEADELLSQLAHSDKNTSNVVTFPKKPVLENSAKLEDPEPAYTVTSDEPEESLPSPELVLKLLEANCQASGMTKTDWQKQFSGKAGISESLLRLIMLGHRNLTAETLKKVLPHVTRNMCKDV
jgi:hypothetical protein